MRYSFVFATAIVISGLMPLGIFAASPDGADSAEWSTKNDGGSPREVNKKSAPHMKPKPSPATEKEQAEVMRNKHEKKMVNPCHGDPIPSWCK